ncbi:hypothetical protein L195_g041347, partial [Trifolium pratense]
SSIGEEYGKCGGRGFMKGPAFYMVTDDLVVTPSTSFTVISFLSNLGILSSDLEEKVITIGKRGPEYLESFFGVILCSD